MLEQLQETTLCESSLTVDRDAGVIRGVKILGVKSRNGREYARKAMESASKLYADCTVNLNHPNRHEADKERAFEDGIGWFEGVDVRGDGVYADLHLLKEHTQFGAVCESAERSPKRFGLSHNAEGPVEHRNGTNIVEDIERVHSVDIVRNPATNAGLFESEYQPMSKKTTLKQLVSEAAKSTKGFKRVLLEMEGEGMLADEGAMDVPAEASAAEAVAEKLADKAKEIFLDPNIDPKTTAKKVGELAKAAEDVKAKLDTSGAGEESEETEEAGGEEETMESEHLAKLNRKMAILETKNAILEAKKEANSAMVEALSNLTESKRAEAIAGLPGGESRRQKPKSGSVLESYDDGDDGYGDVWESRLAAARK